ncbi:tRNA dimethylallyltransferase [Trifolium repens]|nr:tRNA dimethylallyltransferase [Trifolium repens]
MFTISSSTFTNTNIISFSFPSHSSSISSSHSQNQIFHTTHFTKPILFPNPLSISLRKPITTIVFCKSPEASSESEELSNPEDEWLQKLPDKTKPLYSHSLPCIEAWLKSLGFNQSKDERASWIVNKGDWHAQLSLDVTDLYIRYLKSGPGNLEKDVERRFSYALSREDIENAVLGGP